MASPTSRSAMRSTCVCRRSGVVSCLLSPCRQICGDMRNRGIADVACPLYLGSWAEQVVCPEFYVAPKPKGLSFEDAASLPLAAVTALQALRKYRGSLEGKTVFVPAGRECGTSTYILTLKIVLILTLPMDSERNGFIRLPTGQERLPCRQSHHDCLDGQSSQGSRAVG